MRGTFIEVDPGHMVSRLSNGTCMAWRDTGEAKSPYLRELL